MTARALPKDLRRLEAESIYLFREVAAEFDKPVLLYSIGKDSSVLLHLAHKAFFPSPPPFPVLHIDTTWKFRDMIGFRDAIAARFGLDLIVHVNRDGLAQGVNPFTYGSSFYTHVMKAEALKQALSRYGFDAAFGGARRDEEKSRAKWMTISVPSSSGCQSIGSARSGCFTTSISALNAGLGSDRTATRTVAPFSANAATTARPRKPVAPVTRTRFMLFRTPKAPGFLP